MRCPHCLKAFYRPIMSIHMRMSPRFNNRSHAGLKETACNLGVKVKPGCLTDDSKLVNCRTCLKVLAK